MTPLRIALVITAALLLDRNEASAHDMTVTARVIGEKQDQVRIEAGFDDDTPASEAVVRVRNEVGREVATGKLDDKGVWIFPRPGPGKYTIRVEYIGHDRELVLELPEDPAPNTVATTKRSVIAGAIGGVALLLGVSFLFWFEKRRRVRVGAADPDV